MRLEFRTAIWMWVLSQKPAAGVDRVAFHEYATHGVERRQSHLFAVLVNVIYNRTVEMPLQEVAAAFVFWKVGVMELRAFV